MIFEFRYTVPAADIDELGHAGNYHYVRWMQLAAVAHSTAIGWSSRSYRELGAGWVVRSHMVSYLKPAFEGETLIIRTWIADLKTATSLRKYQIVNARGETLATAETDWAFINYARQKPVRIPAQIRSGFEPYVTNGEDSPELQ